MLDFHSHLIPGVDDGAANLDESRRGLAALAADGIDTIITTPHIAASAVHRDAFDSHLEQVALAWESLAALAAGEFPEIRIARGFEVMLDLPHPKLDNGALRLAGTSFALVEFPFMSIPPNSAFALRELRQAGVRPIIAHPERYGNMDENIGVLSAWREAGAFLQINSGSLVGAYGARPKRLGWAILDSGNADYMCSDYHSRGRVTVAMAYAEMMQRGMEAQVETLKTNGRRVIDDEMPFGLEPFTAKTKTGWKKVFPWS
jgi:protein-tyrosine phosphatase